MLPAQTARGLKNVKFEKAGLPAKSEMHDGTVTVPSWCSNCTMTLFAVQCGCGFEGDLREFCLNLRLAEIILIVLMPVVEMEVHIRQSGTDSYR